MLRSLGRTLAPLFLGLVACSAPDSDVASDEGAVRVGDAVLVPETAPSDAIVLANADGYAGVNELHYHLMRGLFADRALDGVKIHYLTPFDARDVAAETRAKDGDRIMARFGTRFETEFTSKRINAVRSRVDSNWARDYFPMVAKDAAGKKRAVRFSYSRTPHAGPAGEKVAKDLGYEVITSDLVVEGGNIMVDEGTLFTTDVVIERNKPKTKAQIEAEFKRVLGVGKVVWLKPLPGEATGHVDIFAKVVGPKKVIVTSSDYACGEDSPPSCKPRQPTLDDNAKVFEQNGYRVTRVKNGETKDDFRALSYANSLLVNGAAFVPTYFQASDADDLNVFEPDIPVSTIAKGCTTKLPFPGTTEYDAYRVSRERALCTLEGVVKAARNQNVAFIRSKIVIAKRDQEAKEAYERLGYRVVQVPALAMINNGGSVHCVTMQVAK